MSHSHTLTIEQAVQKIREDMSFAAPEVRTPRLLSWLESYGMPLYRALRALPAEEQTDIGLDGVRPRDGIEKGLAGS